ncbi:nucleoprotein TPR [Aplysia californica]|uniref:Nucleoprotein TPR n=1 Tax=Aplysia californica TaxID=6500 RepID=A0ABM1A0S1_APLCA|nr:nucleoprotein TPR [Aplysia californica]
MGSAVVKPLARRRGKIKGKDSSVRSSGDPPNRKENIGDGEANVNTVVSPEVCTEKERILTPNPSSKRNTHSCFLFRPNIRLTRRRRTPTPVSWENKEDPEPVVSPCQGTPAPSPERETVGDSKNVPKLPEIKLPVPPQVSCRSDEMLLLPSLHAKRPAGNQPRSNLTPVGIHSKLPPLPPIFSLSGTSKSLQNSVNSKAISEATEDDKTFSRSYPTSTSPRISHINSLQTDFPLNLKQEVENKTLNATSMCSTSLKLDGRDTSVKTQPCGERQSPALNSEEMYAASNQDLSSDDKDACQDARTPSPEFDDLEDVKILNPNVAEPVESSLPQSETNNALVSDIGVSISKTDQPAPERVGEQRVEVDHVVFIKLSPSKDQATTAGVPTESTEVSSLQDEKETNENNNLPGDKENDTNLFCERRQAQQKCLQVESYHSRLENSPTKENSDVFKEEIFTYPNATRVILDEHTKSSSEKEDVSLSACEEENNSSNLDAGEMRLLPTEEEEEEEEEVEEEEEEEEVEQEEEEEQEEKEEEDNEVVLMSGSGEVKSPEQFDLIENNASMEGVETYKLPSPPQEPPCRSKSGSRPSSCRSSRSKSSQKSSVINPSATFSNENASVKSSAVTVNDGDDAIPRPPASPGCEEKEVIDTTSRTSSDLEDKPSDADHPRPPLRSAAMETRSCNLEPALSMSERKAEDFRPHPARLAPLNLPGRSASEVSAGSFPSGGLLSVKPFPRESLCAGDVGERSSGADGSVQGGICGQDRGDGDCKNVAGPSTSPHPESSGDNGEGGQTTEPGCTDQLVETTSDISTSRSTTRTLSQGGLVAPADEAADPEDGESAHPEAQDLPIEPSGPAHAPVPETPTRDDIKRQTFEEGLKPSTRDGGVSYFIPVTEGGLQPPVTSQDITERLTKTRKCQLKYEERMILANINRQVQISKRKEFAIRDLQNVRGASGSSTASGTDISRKSKSDEEYDLDTEFDL